jgi:hypothetical protein
MGMQTDGGAIGGSPGLGAVGDLNLALSGTWWAGDVKVASAGGGAVLLTVRKCTNPRLVLCRLTPELPIPGPRGAS